MATSPQFAATPRAAGVLTPTTLDTSLTAPANTTTLWTAGASGSKVDIIRINQVATTATTGIVNLFVYTGTVYYLFDTYTFFATTLTTSTELQPVDIYYNALVLQTGYSLRVTTTVAGGQAAFSLLAFGGDF